ncbi:unnamed protein product [Effrenium voratum]|nr:unnamed protein product [Effrenium voratum]
MSCFVLIDVREQWEWDAGHASCATRLQIQKQQPANWREEVLNLTAGNKDTPVMVYCAAGVRAQTAADMLLAEGYTAVTNGGGYSNQLESNCNHCDGTKSLSGGAITSAPTQSAATAARSTILAPLLLAWMCFRLFRR